MASFKHRLRHPAVFLTVLTLAAFAFVVGTQSLTPQTASASHAGPVTVTITKVINIGDEGIEDNLRGEADMYAYVEIGGTPFDSKSVHVDGDDNIEPFWAFSKNFAGGDPDFVNVHIEIWDHDDCGAPRCSFSPDPLGGSDDRGDVDSDPGDDTVDLVVDRTTGTWTGDTTNNCAQGDDTGDGDRRVLVCWDISTLSASGDADGDGLLDSWETNGLDSDGNGTIDVDLPTFGADPNHKDLFLELDFVTGQTPNAGGIAAMQAAFAAAPINAGGVNNPDGQPGINLWVDTGGAAGGNNLGGGNTANGDPNCMNASFYTFKNANFNSNRRWVFRYGIVGDPNDSSPCGGGQGEIGGNDFIEYNHDGGTIMHEFGHTLNLRHGGNVNDNCKPNYVSAMNYDSQFGINQAGGGTIIDYSPPRFAAGRGVAPLPTIVENNLNEGMVLDSTDATNQFVFVNGLGQKTRAQLNGPVDWNGDGDTADNPVTVNVDTVGMNGRPSRCSNGSNNSTLTGHDDWTVIAMNFRPFGDSADSAINPFPDPEITLVELLQLQQELNTTDLAISKFDSPDPVVAGGQLGMLYYTITVSNNGPNPANSVKVTDTLPTGLIFVTSTDTCAEAPAGTLTCNLGTIAADDSKTFTVKMEVPSNYIVGTGPVGITNTATVENVGGTDSDPSNNTASASTIVEDSADLRVTKICRPDEPLRAGETGTCTIYVDNLGPSDARNVVLTDSILSDGAFTVTGASAAPGGACPVAAGVVTCNLGTEPAGGRTTITVTVTANDAVVINDVATVTSATPDPDPTNSQATESISVTAVADLSITKSDSEDPLVSGTSLTYSLLVHNNGPSTAVNVRAEDLLPAGVSIDSVSGTGGAACVFGVPGDNSRPTVCTFGSIPPGGSRTMTIVVTVLPGSHNSLHNDARVSSDVLDLNNANDVDSEDTQIRVMDLEIVKTSDADVYKSSGSVVYTLTVNNKGPADAQNVVVTDNLPVIKQDRVIWVPGSPTCSKPANGTLLTCNLGTIAAGGTKKVTVIVIFKGSRGVVSNTADVTTSTFDHDLSNNSSTKTVLVGSLSKP